MMNILKETWVKSPSKKQMITIIVFWLVGVAACVLSITNFFTETFLKGSYFMIYFLMLMSTVTVVKVIRNYNKLHS